MIVGQYLEIGKVFLKNYKVKKVDIKNLPKLHSPGLTKIIILMKLAASGIKNLPNPHFNFCVVEITEFFSQMHHAHVCPKATLIKNIVKSTYTKKS